MKLPFFQFYPSDYMRDTRVLSLAAKGGWVDVLCMLHGSSTRGTVTLPVVGWARIMGATVDQAVAVIAELEVMQVADVVRDGNGNVTLTNRRMMRDHITREQTRLRVANHRRNKSSNAAGSGEETPKKSETRNQKPEVRSDLAKAPPPRARNDLLDALCRHAERTDPLTAQATLWPKLARALKTIRDATPDVVPAEIERRCTNYQSHFRGATISATALANHWGRCAEASLFDDDKKRAGWL